MAKYITLDGLSTFLNTIKSDKFLAIDTCYGCIKTGYEENDNNYAIKVDTFAWATVPWTNSKVTSIDNHYQQTTKPTQTTEGLYKIKIDDAGHITSSNTLTKNDFFNYWPEIEMKMNESIYKELTYATLKDLRDNNSLAAGRLYRITDYIATTKYSNSTSDYRYYEFRNPGQFDIIVEAISSSSISETARVCHHEGDTYFAECELDKWEIKYCIDNDDNRFEWAHPDGKGVIYYMKDEWGNEVPFDFKNLLPPGYGTSTYLFYNVKNKIKDIPINNNYNDASVKGYKFDQTEETELPRKDNIFPTNNIIKPSYDRGLMKVISVLFVPASFDYSAGITSNKKNFTGISNNYIDYNCSNILFFANLRTYDDSIYNGSYGCHNNIIGRGCDSIEIINSSNNEIGDGTKGIQLNYCENNKIGRGCHNIKFIDFSSSYHDPDFQKFPIQMNKNNIIGNYLNNITMGVNCNNNIFENWGGDTAHNSSELGHCCNNNLIKTNSGMNLNYHKQTSETNFNLYALPGVENCIFNKCINSGITFLELSPVATQKGSIYVVPHAIGEFYFDNGTPLYDKYIFRNFEFANISSKNSAYNFECLVYDNDSSASVFLNEIQERYIGPLRRLFNASCRMLVTLDTTDTFRKLNVVSKYG